MILAQTLPTPTVTPVPAGGGLDGLPDWTVTATILVALIAAAAAISGAVIARSTQRTIRGRLGNDIAAWEKLPAGSYARSRMFKLIEVQIAALTDTTTGKAQLRAARFYAGIFAVFVVADLVILLAMHKVEDSWLSRGPEAVTTPQGMLILALFVSALLAGVVTLIFFCFALSNLVGAMWSRFKLRSQGRGPG